MSLSEQERRRGGQRPCRGGDGFERHPPADPFDEMLAAMYSVGKKLPYELRETALGGCAATPYGCDLPAGNMREQRY